jgi:nitrate/TMAO reductase-like tetraheme cytochrome c subunit
MKQRCISCNKIKDIQEFNLEKTKAGNEYYRTKCKKCRNLYRVASKRQREHGMSLEEYNDLLNEQKYLCAICGTDLTQLDTREVHLDHNHETGKIRGILCGHCNLGIGHFSDDISRLQSAIDYLQEHSDD